MWITRSASNNPVRVASSLASPKDIRTSVRAQCAKHSKPQSIAHSAQPCAAGIIPLGSPVLLASAKELIRLFPQLSPSGSRIRGIYLGSARCIGSNAVRPPVPHSRDQPIHAKRKMWITRSASNNPVRVATLKSSILRMNTGSAGFSCRQGSASIGKKTPVFLAIFGDKLATESGPRPVRDAGQSTNAPARHRVACHLSRST